MKPFCLLHLHLEQEIVALDRDASCDAYGDDAFCDVGWLQLLTK
jgi:hypothetical protein